MIYTRNPGHVSGMCGPFFILCSGSGMRTSEIGKKRKSVDICSHKVYLEHMNRCAYVQRKDNHGRQISRFG